MPEKSPSSVRVCVPLCASARVCACVSVSARVSACVRSLRVIVLVYMKVDFEDKILGDVQCTIAVKLAMRTPKLPPKSLICCDIHKVVFRKRNYCALCFLFQK